jgi:tRNA U38,U39,U40 pseudouridine synthase TruA
VEGGVKKIIRQACEEDEFDVVEKALDRNIDHIPKETMEANYSFRLCEEKKAFIKEVWESYVGTKNYHNFTKGLKATEMSANRFMMEMYADRYLYFNQDSGELTN